ncbi:MAG: [protein-PII] uridylyltransferase [Rhodospirillales bacterium]|jgi:[protein-PII] uridylyltransferase|nr:[protein-PII] uridylyltransferase [Rhodospirillales bacterium]
MNHGSDIEGIVDRGAIAAALRERAASARDAARSRSETLAILRTALDQSRAEIRDRFENAAMPGSAIVRANAQALDGLVVALFDFVLEHVYPLSNPTKGEQLSLAAVGGFGRGELAPFSDVDLMFLLPYRQTPRGEQVIEYMLYTLWDLGLKVGHATRSVDDAIKWARDDVSVRTSLLESRRLCGDAELFDRFSKRFSNEIVQGSGADFVEAKLVERDQRHARTGDTRYVLEPNVKEGKGGLRDLHTLFWIGRYLYQVGSAADLVAHGVLTPDDVRRFAKAENFLWTVRCHLHYLAGRAEERLTFDVQTGIGERMGYTDHAGARGVERFMKHYFLTAKDVGDLTRIVCAVLEEQHKKRTRRLRVPAFFRARPSIEGFVVDADRLNVTSADAFAKDPVKLIRLFHEAQHHSLDIHPQALRLVSLNLHLIDNALRADADANRLFMEMLTSDKDPETALKRLNEAGVFGRFVPDFGRVVAQMQYDMYHVYTVDEHTIRAIGIVHRIETGELKDDHPVASAAIPELQSRRTLYLALLLHDVAKGRGGDHSAIGAGIALKTARRMGLTDWECETASWLVRNHLLMSLTAFKRDIEDDKTVADFVAAVQSPERLRLLLILTVADIRAVGPGVWNAWKATLLREVYFRAMEEMTGGAPAERRGARVERAKEALRQRLEGWPPREVEAFIARGYPNYWLTFDADSHEHHAKVVREANRRKLPLHVETRVEPARAVTEVVIYTADHVGLFAEIAGAMALAGASIVDAKIATLADGMVLDTFWIQGFEGGAIAGRERLKKIWARIEDTLSGRIDPARELDIARRRTRPGRTGVFKVPPRVLVDNVASADSTVIEVNGRDRIGFLFDVTSAITHLGLQISSAHVSTWGERVVDVFYVKDMFGLKVERADRLDLIRETLLQAIASPGPTEPGAERVAAE